MSNSHLDTARACEGCDDNVDNLLRGIIGEVGIVRGGDDIGNGENNVDTNGQDCRMTSEEELVFIVPSTSRAETGRTWRVG